MRRIKVLLVVTAAMVMMLAAVAGPALAADNNDRHLDRQDIRFDRQLVNNDFLGFGVPLFFNGFGFENSCPFAGDTEGVVNEFDCFE